MQASFLFAYSRGSDYYGKNTRAFNGRRSKTNDCSEFTKKLYEISRFF